MIQRLFVFSWLLIAVTESNSFGIQPQPPVRVYWDISHGVVDNYQPSGRYSVLVQHLAPLGFTVTEGNVSLDAANLNSSDVLVLANGSFASTFPSASELGAVQSFLQRGGGLLVLSDIAGSSGTPKIQQIANLFGAQVGLTKFPPDDVYSTSVASHPSVAGVEQAYFRFSSTFTPGALTPYVFYDTMPMLAAGAFGGGRVVLIADGDLFTKPPFGQSYFDLADNRLLAESVFRYLAVPEPNTIIMCAMGVVTILFLCRLPAERISVRID